MFLFYCSQYGVAERLISLPCLQVAFRLSASIKVDERVFAHLLSKTLPTNYLLQTFYPHLYPVHALNDEVSARQDDENEGDDDNGDDDDGDHVVDDDDGDNVVDDDDNSDDCQLVVVEPSAFSCSQYPLITGTRKETKNIASTLCRPVSAVAPVVYSYC